MILESSKILQHPLLGPLVALLKEKPKRVVFPDGEDVRVLRVASALVKLECISPILLGNKARIQEIAKAEGISLEFIRLLNPADSSDFQAYCERYRRSRRYLRHPVSPAEEIMCRPGYFAAMMVLYNAADAIVGGNESLPAAFFRSLLHILPKTLGVSSVTSFLPVYLPHRADLGVNGVLFLTDCAVIPTPTVAELGFMAIEAGKAVVEWLQERPRIAFLSFATRDTAKNLSTEKTAAAVQMARQLLHDQPLPVEMELDGPLQLDAALDPAAAERKAGRGPVAGKANILVFPDLNSSHIAFKLLRLIGNAETFGHHLIGLTRPAVQVSRMATEQTILGAALLAGYRSIQFRTQQLLEANDQ